MSSAENALGIARRPTLLVMVSRLAASSRFYVYLACCLLAVITSYHLGKDMSWDTVDYHLYLGFSALHNRFAQDYFASGAQAYLNPYAMVPFYLLATSGLTALQAASILAVVQSAILWLTYELAMIVAPDEGSRLRIGFGVCAAALAFLNPVLISQFGSSYTDITTAEIVLWGWLLLARAVRSPSAVCVVLAGLLLGSATALKLSNSLDAISAGVLLLFLPMRWAGRLRQGALYMAAVAFGFVIVSLPWSIRLEEHFGNPMFPMLNGLFRSPEFFTAPTIDYRFIPTSLGAALVRPLEMVLPNSMIQVEEAAPDARYALLLVLAIGMLLACVWKYLRRSNVRPLLPVNAPATRVLAALGCGFVADWVLWLTISGNGRYFIPMACVAAVLCVAAIFGLFSARPRVRNYLLASVFLVQAFQLHAGTQYLEKSPWRDRPWFDVSMPSLLASEPALYFNIGVESNAFLAPFVAPGAGFVNLEGDYTLGPGGPNGARIAALIRRYSPHLRALVRGTPNLANIDDVLAPFGLKVAPDQCAKIVAHDFPPSPLGFADGPLSNESDAGDAYFVSCMVIPGSTLNAETVAAGVVANHALDHLEDACPALFQPARPPSVLNGDKRRGYVWTRRYNNKGMAAWVIWGQVKLQAMLGGPEIDAGSESTWAKAPLPVECGKTEHGYFFRRR